MIEALKTLGIAGVPLFLCSFLALTIIIRQAVFLLKKQKGELPGEEFLEFLATFTPMLGLFGTVLGIIAAFKSIKEASTAVTPSLISGGLYEALFTTAFGLSIALFCLFWLTCARQINNSRNK